jgi:hypothetical protein
MLPCKMVDFLYAVLPLKMWRGFLLRRHIERCPFCREKLAGREAVKSLMVTDDNLGPRPSFWPQVKTRLVSLEEDRLKGKPLLGQKRWRWAAQAAALLIIGLASFLLLKDFRPEKMGTGQEASSRFRINYLKVEDKPAQAYLYQPSESNLIIIWVGKSS